MKDDLTPYAENPQSAIRAGSVILHPSSFILCFLLATTCALAQSFPTKPIRFLVPFGPGGVGDITARVVAQKMSDQMGQQVIIDNRPGAGGVVATEIVAK